MKESVVIVLVSAVSILCSHFASETAASLNMMHLREWENKITERGDGYGATRTDVGNSHGPVWIAFQPGEKLP